MAAKSVGVLVGLCAFACAGPALGAVPAQVRGTVQPVERAAAPSFGWLPVVAAGSVQEGEPELAAPALSRGPYRAPHVVALAPAREALAASARFQGATSFGAGNHSPADVQIAVGAGDVVQLVNTLMTVWTTGGTLLKTLSLQALTGTIDKIVDPRVMFDAQTGRWLIAAMDATPGGYSVWVGASQTSDPTGAWWFYFWPKLGTSSCFDQPRLGYSSSVVTFSANVYQTCLNYAGTQLWVLNKSQLLSGSPVEYATWAPNDYLWSTSPVQSLTATDVQYGVSVGGNELTLVTITGIPPAPTTLTYVDLPIASLTRPSEAVQAGAAEAIDSGTVRTLDAVWSNGLVWTTTGDSCLPPGDATRRACARVTAATTAPAAIVDDTDLSLGPGSYVYYPAVRADAFGNAVVVFGYSSASEFPSVGVATKAVGAPWEKWAPIAAGTAANTSGRWGDYFSAATDPNAPGRVWVSAQFGQATDGTRPGNGWGTVVGSVVRNAQPAVVTYPSPSASRVDRVSATLAASIDSKSDDATWRLEYGKTTDYGFATQTFQLAAAAAAQPVSVRVAGLAAGTAYHFRVVASNSAGTSYGADQMFTTAKPAAPKPKPAPKKKKKAAR